MRRKANRVIGKDTEALGPVLRGHTAAKSDMVFGFGNARLWDPWFVE